MTPATVVVSLLSLLTVWGGHVGGDVDVGYDGSESDSAWITLILRMVLAAFIWLMRSECEPIINELAANDPAAGMGTTCTALAD